MPSRVARTPGTSIRRTFVRDALVPSRQATDQQRVERQRLSSQDVARAREVLRSWRASSAGHVEASGAAERPVSLVSALDACKSRVLHAPRSVLSASILGPQLRKYYFSYFCDEYDINGNSITSHNNYRSENTPAAPAGCNAIKLAPDDENIALRGSIYARVIHASRRRVKKPLISQQVVPPLKSFSAMVSIDIQGVIFIPAPGAYVDISIGVGVYQFRGLPFQVRGNPFALPFLYRKWDHCTWTLTPTFKNVRYDQVGLFGTEMISVTLLLQDVPDILYDDQFAVVQEVLVQCHEGYSRRMPDVDFSLNRVGMLKMPRPYFHVALAGPRPRAGRALTR